MTPNKPIPIEATPIARRNDGLLEPGHTVTISPKTKIAAPVIASETHALVNRTLSRLLIMTNSLDNLDNLAWYGTAW
jgi:hypothetical protein